MEGRDQRDRFRRQWEPFASAVDRITSIAGAVVALLVNIFVGSFRARWGGAFAGLSESRADRQRKRPDP